MDLRWENVFRLTGLCARVCDEVVDDKGIDGVSHWSNMAGTERLALSILWGVR
jgi:hypothetical protein